MKAAKGSPRIQKKPIENEAESIDSDWQGKPIQVLAQPFHIRQCTAVKPAGLAWAEQNFSWKAFLCSNREISQQTKFRRFQQKVKWFLIILTS